MSATMPLPEQQLPHATPAEQTAKTVPEARRAAAFAMTQRLVLDEPGRCWLVEAGTVDLFLADLAGGIAASSLEYVGTLATGAAMLGLGSLDAGSGRNTALVAQGDASARLRPMLLTPPGEATADVATGDADGQLLTAEQIDEWIVTLSGFCAPGRPPVHSWQVAAGEWVTPAAEDPAVSSSAPMVLIGNRAVNWVDGLRKAPGVYGQAPVAQSAVLPVPVSRSLWIAVALGQSFRCRTTVDWLNEARAQGTVARDLMLFHRAMLTERHTFRLATAAADRVRFQIKVQRDGQRFGAALRELISPLEPGAAAAQAEPESAGGDAQETGFQSALGACRAVGGVMGIPIVAPASRNPAATPGAVETAAEAVLRVASSSAVRYRRVLLRDGWWKQDQGPMIGFTLNGAAAVAFLPAGRAGYAMLDPMIGRRTRVTEELSASLDANAYVLYRSFPNRKLRLLDLFTFGLRNGRMDLITILVISAATGLLALVMPIATGVLFDEVIPEGQRSNLIQLSGILLSASVAMFLMSLAQSFATQRLEGRMDSELEAALWDRLLNMRTGFFRQFTTGDLASRSLAINQIRQILTGTAISALLSGVFSVFSLVLLFGYSPGLALLAIGLVGVAIAVSAVSTWISIRLQRQSLALQGRIAGRVTELLGGVSKFRVAGAEPTAFARWAEGYAEQKRTRLHASRISLGMGIFDSIFPAISTILIFMTAANMIKADPRFSVGHFLAFNAAFGQFLAATLGFSSAVLAVIGIVPIYERARPILEELPERKPDLIDPGPLKGDIELSHVSFRYVKDGPLILDDVSMTIRAGQYVALVGESGCGKSTLMRLLLGFEVPDEGSVSYDGRDLAELDMQAMRRQIGVVLQSGKLMPTDVYTNIIGASTLSMDQAWEAAKRAGMDDDIRAMPMGMHTVLTEGGGGISGGQRQRLLIARAIVHRPRILFFDEATSALDNQTQAIVSASLDAMQSTRIVIAHRLSTILEANQILVFKAGRLHESGTYEELLARGGYFAELAQRQLA